MVLFKQSLRLGLLAVALLARGPAASQIIEIPHFRAPEGVTPPFGGMGTGSGGLFSTATVTTFDLRAQAPTSADSAPGVVDGSTLPPRADPVKTARAVMDRFLDDLPVVQKHRRTP